MKEEIKKYFKIDIYKLENEKKELNNNYILYYDLLQEIKDRPEEERKKEIEKYNQQQKEIEEKTQSINNKIDILKIEKNLVYNNIIYLFYKNYHNIILNIMEKYKNKNIGEKTKEKIQDEIKEELKKDGIFSSVYFTFGSYSCDIYKLNFTIYETEKEQLNYSYKRIEFDFNLCNYYNETEKEKYNNYFTYRNEKTGSIIIHNNALWEKDSYNYITEPKKTSKDILKECKKSMEKVNKLIETAKKERKKHNQLLNNYKIQEFDNIKIEYNQTL